MKHNNLVKISISTALAAVLFAGCGSSTPAESLTGSSAQMQKQSQKKPLAQSLNTLSGKIRLDTSPVNNRTTQTLGNNVYSITAYNLNDDSVYKTTTNASGIYTLSGLSDGEYQIYAQNKEVAKSAIKRVTLERGTRKVVDFVLQAAGSVKGQIKGAEVVYIPGKDFIAIPDENGYFELTNIPVGTYVLKFEMESDYKHDHYIENRTGTLDITVQEGMTDLALITPSFDIFRINTALPYGTLGLHHHGIGIKSDLLIDTDVLSNAVVLTNAAGEKIPVHIELHYEHYGLISTKDIVPAGDYTLTIPASVSKGMTEDFVQTFHVDKLCVAFVENDTGSGARYLNLDLPVKLDDTQKASLGTLTVKEKGSTQTLAVKAVWTGDDKIALFGNFKTGVEYVIDLTDAQKEILGEVKIYGEKLMFGTVELNGLYPSDGATEVNIGQTIYANIQNIRELDPSTVKFTLSDGTQTTTYEKGDIVFSSMDNYYNTSYDNYFNSYSGAIGVKNAKLAYGKEYTLKVEAQDVYGNALVAQSVFHTLTPAVRNISPNDLEELFRGDLQVEFNVEIQKEAGKISIVDLTDPAQKPEINIEKHLDKQDPYMNEPVYFSPTNTVHFDIEGLKPEHKYKITAAGFKSKDGTEIPAKSSEFTTPPKMLFIPEEYRQNIFVNPQNFEHKVRFFVFGGLSDTEKAFMEEHLQVTSYGSTATPDATHPVRKLFFLEESDGVEVVVAFTIDENTNYELAFNDISGLAGIIMPRGFEAGKPLVSFSTRKMNTSGSSTSGDHLLIRNMRVYADGTEGKIELDAAIPLGKISVHESCWNRFGNDLENIDLTRYVHVTDKENNEVPVSFKEYMNYNMGSEYFDDNMRMCTLYISSSETNAHFPVDFNNSYIITADFTKDFADSGYTALSLSKELKTAPIGEINYWIDDNGGKDAVLFHIHTNAPLVNPNILKVTIGGEEYRPTLPYGEIYDDQTPPVSDIVFELPRPLYSLVSFTLSKDDGSVLKFFNPLNQTETERGDILTVSKTFTESISPDFVPVKVETVHTASIQNRFVIAEFNRMLRMDDIATYSDPDKTQLSDVAFEIKDADGTPVVISGVKQMGTTIGFELSEELNASKIYTLSLKDGKTVQSAFGVQKLTSFSQMIDLTVIDVRDAYLSGINSSFDPQKPYMLGSTEELYAEDIGFNYMAVPVGTAEGVLIDIAKSRVNVHTSFGEVVNQGVLVADENLLVQPISDYYDYSSLVADVLVSYTYQNETKEYTKTLDNISQQPVAKLSSIISDGVNSLRFNFDMEPANISEANFRIFNMDDTPASDVTLSVQVDPGNPNSAIVTFDNLAADTTYRVDVVGLSAFGNPVYSDTLVSQVFIQIPAAE